MTAQPGLWAQASDTAGFGTPLGTRLALGGLMRRNGIVKPRTGILYGPGNPLNVTGRGDMSVDVAAGAAVTAYSDTSGPYIVGNDGTVQVPLNVAASGSNAAINAPVGGNRYDLVCIYFRDIKQGAAATEVGFEIVPGVTGSGTYPAVPDGYLALAAVLRTPSGTTSNALVISNIAPFTTAESTQYFRTIAERDAFPIGRGSVTYLQTQDRAQLTLQNDTEVNLATWDDLPRVRNNPYRLDLSGGAIQGAGAVRVMPTLATVTVPPGRVGWVNAFQTFHLWLSGTATMAGFLTLLIDGNVAGGGQQRFHNHARSVGGLYQPSAWHGASIPEGTHTIALSMQTDGAASTVEIWDYVQQAVITY
jgi:hypothetical protein